MLKRDRKVGGCFFPDFMKLLLFGPTSPRTFIMKACRILPKHFIGEYFCRTGGFRGLSCCDFGMRHGHVYLIGDSRLPLLNGSLGCFYSWPN